MADVKSSEDNYKVLMGYKQRLQMAKKVAEDTKTARITGEATIKQLTKNEDVIVEKIKALGYDPSNLRNIISDMVGELGGMLDKIEQVSPDENGIMPENAKDILGIKSAEETVVEESIIVDKSVDPYADVDLNDVVL